MAVIQEYYSSRFDPGAPALVSFLGGFMESRRELNQMAFKERLKGIDPRAAAMVEAAAIKRRTELEKMAQDAVIARDSNDVKLKTASNDNLTKLMQTSMQVSGGLAEKRTEVGEKAASRERSRQVRIDRALQDADTKTTTVGTSAKPLAGETPNDTLNRITSTVDAALGGANGIYTRITDPEAQAAAKTKLYEAAYTQAEAAGADATVLSGIREKFSGMTPTDALRDVTRQRSPKEVASEIPMFGVDALGSVARATGLSTRELQSRLQGEIGIQPMTGAGVQVAPTTGPATMGGAEVVGSMPAATGAVAPPLFEAEIAQAKALEEQARQQRLGGRGAVPYGQTEVGRANLLYGMPYYRSRPVEMEDLASRAPAEAEEAAVTGMEAPVYKRESMDSGTRYDGGPALQARAPYVPTAGVDKPAPRLEVPLSPQATSFVKSAASEMDADLIEHPRPSPRPHPCRRGRDFVHGRGGTEVAWPRPKPSSSTKPSTAGWTTRRSRSSWSASAPRLLRPRRLRPSHPSPPHLDLRRRPRPNPPRSRQWLHRA
jgi:hypothetical protein